MRIGCPLLLLAAAIVGILLLGRGVASPPAAPAPYAAPGRVIITLNTGQRYAACATGRGSLRRLSPAAGCGPAVYALRDPGRDTETLVRDLAADPGVLLVEPDAPRHAALIPNDPLWNAANNWAVKKINCPAAWDAATGSPTVVIAVIDTGVNAVSDLASRHGSNPGEVADGSDTDGNGFVDDLGGWDWVNDDNDPADDGDHGTAVASVIGAAGNNAKAMTGVLWDCRIMPLKVLASSGTGSTSDVIAAVYYAVDNGARIINLSLSGDTFIAAEKTAIEYASSRGVLVITAAGNNQRDIDAAPTYPACHDVPNIVSVGAGTQSDAVAWFSNWGLGNVDLFAPGEGILCLDPYGGVGLGQGTSFATPFVAGAAGLRIARLGSWSPVEQTAIDLRQWLIAGADPAAGFDGKCLSGGRLDAAGTPATGILPVYRFWSPVLTSHFYTISESEKNLIVASWPGVWSLEGTAFYGYPVASPPAGGAPVYRFWSPTLGSHFYTMSAAERDLVIATWPGAWAYEGIAWYAYPADAPAAATFPVYRFWSEAFGAHFYTIDEAEKDFIIASWPEAWTLEGVAWYADRNVAVIY